MLFSEFILLVSVGFALCWKCFFFRVTDSKYFRVADSEYLLGMEFVKGGFK